jgi:two-component system, sensor histidine kinase and response regulator
VILLAEDSAVNQRLALAQLERHGQRVVVANNGKDAVEKWESHPFDLILMDVQMPEMDGFTATRLIRERERRTGAHIPIVAMTAHAMKGDRERCLEAGMDAYVPKPIRANDLFATIEKLFATRPAAKLAAGDGGPPERSGPLAVQEQAAPASNSLAENAPDVLDWNAALKQNDIGATVLREMAALFLSESVKLLTEIREATARSDAKALRRAAHTVKGSAAAFLAQPATEAASRLESIAKEGRLTEAEGARIELEREINRLCGALQAQLGLSESEP